ncbi:6-bladed beta-propeller [Enterocloster citroniae]
MDVTKKYSKRELILQDFMNVEYIALETNDEFLCEGLVQAIGNNIIITRNLVMDGNIFIFDRNGKSLKKINRKGSGPEEYVAYLRLRLDEENGNIHVYSNRENTIYTYDLNGNFKDKIKHKEEIKLYKGLFVFDSENYIYYDDRMSNYGEVSVQSFGLMSKTDGRINKEIEFIFDEKNKLGYICAG